MNTQRYATLNTGAKIELVGYGTWQATDDELEQALEKALEVGYRHIDTAALYKNEHVIGKVLNRWLSAGKLKREDLFITTKLPHYAIQAKLVPKYLEQSLSDLQLDYVDLYLIHMPFGLLDENELNDDGTVKLDLNTDHISVWKAMEAQMDAGKAKAIGISNFNKSQVQRVLTNARIKPASLQIELHAYMQQKPLVEFCKKHNIVVTSYSTLGSKGTYQTILKGKEAPNMLENDVILNIGRKYGKTPAQVLLRHMVQQNIVVIPKSTNVKRLKENFQVFDFALNDADMEAIGKLDQGEDGRILQMSAIFPGLINHPEYPFPR